MNSTQYKTPLRYLLILNLLVLFGKNSSGEFLTEEEQERSPANMSRSQRSNSESSSFSSSSSKKTKKRTIKRIRKTSRKATEEEKRRYFVEDTERVDAGVFHVGFGAGGNFYIEPKFDRNNQPLGEFFKDFGFQAGIYLDYDYIDVPLGLRTWIGYKYILSSVHVFDIDLIARYLLAFSDKANVAPGFGVSAAIWFRESTDSSLDEEVVFLPSIFLTLGIDFNPFLVDFKFLVNRIGGDSTILGLELSFGVRL